MKKYLMRFNRYWRICLFVVHAWCYGLFSRDSSEPLSDEEVGFLKRTSPIFRALNANYVKQFNGAACSVASVTAVLNAARELFNDTKGESKITQPGLLDKVKAIHWKERMSPEGYKNRRGLPMTDMDAVVRSSLQVYNLAVERVDTVKIDSDMQELDKVKADLLSRLKAFADSDDTFIIAHFNQGALIRTWHVPHISPVGAFDKDRERVLILDTDQPHPYWVSFDTFFKGLSWDYMRILKKYGFTGGGYIWIKMDKTRAL